MENLPDRPVSQGLGYKVKNDMQRMGHITNNTSKRILDQASAMALS